MTNPLKILIVEDEYITAKSIEKFLIQAGYDIVEIAVNCNEAIEALKSKTINFVLLDINLNDDQNGIWLANYINKNYQLPFVFLTAYSDKKTIQNAIGTEPQSYLTKPFQKAELFSAIELANNTYKKRQSKYLLLKEVDQFEKINIEDILYIESLKNYLKVVTLKKEYKHRATIKDFLQKLPDNFIQTHRGYIINSKKINSINKKEEFIMVSGKKTPISKSHKNEVLEYIDNLCI